jgi:hypothetical protein
MRTVHYRYNNFDIEDDTLTPEQIRESLTDLFPELEKATYRTEGTDIYFDVQADTKGLPQNLRVGKYSVRFIFG